MRTPIHELSTEQRGMLYRDELKATNLIIEERHSQTTKWGVQTLGYNEWMSILMEEVGELAQAVNSTTETGKHTDADNMLEEAIQVAAVAKAIAEQLIREEE